MELLLLLLYTHTSTHTHHFRNTHPSSQTHTHTLSTHTHTHTQLPRLPASLCHVSCTNPGPLPTADVFSLITASVIHVISDYNLEQVLPPQVLTSQTHSTFYRLHLVKALTVSESPKLSPSQSLPLLHPSKSCQSQTHSTSKLPFKPASSFLFTPRPTPSYTTLVLPSSLITARASHLLVF